MSVEVTQALAVTAELCGTNLSEPAVRMLLQDLSAYPEHQVINALTACRKQLKGRLTLSEITSRIDDGRPGVEEAWAKLPRDEATTAIWTDEMRAAWGVASSLLAEGDDIAARMAFKESYQRAVVEAREANRPVKWSVSIGMDEQMRKTAIQDAVEKGLLPSSSAKLYLPVESKTLDEVLMLACDNGALPPEKALQMLAGIKEKFGMGAA